MTSPAPSSFQSPSLRDLSVHLRDKDAPGDVLWRWLAAHHRAHPPHTPEELAVCVDLLDEVFSKKSAMGWVEVMIDHPNLLARQPSLAMKLLAVVPSTESRSARLIDHLMAEESVQKVADKVVATHHRWLLEPTKTPPACLVRLHERGADLSGLWKYAHSVEVSATQLHPALQYLAHHGHLPDTDTWEACLRVPVPVRTYASWQKPPSPKGIWTTWKGEMGDPAWTMLMGWALHKPDTLQAWLNTPGDGPAADRVNLASQWHAMLVPTDNTTTSAWVALATMAVREAWAHRDTPAPPSPKDAWQSPIALQSVWRAMVRLDYPVADRMQVLLTGLIAPHAFPLALVEAHLHRGDGTAMVEMWDRAWARHPWHPQLLRMLDGAQNLRLTHPEWPTSAWHERATACLMQRLERPESIPAASIAPSMARLWRRLCAHNVKRAYRCTRSQRVPITQAHVEQWARLLAVDWAPEASHLLCPALDQAKSKGLDLGAYASSWAIGADAPHLPESARAWCLQQSLQCTLPVGTAPVRRLRV